MQDNATTRTFDIGIQAEMKPIVFEIKLEKQTVSAVSALGGIMQITIYGSVQRHFLPSP